MGSSTRAARAWTFLIVIVATVLTVHAAELRAQDPARDAAPAPASGQRPPEGTWIINLPSADASPAGNLTMLFTHRFAEPLGDSDIHSFFSLDNGANVGIGLGYAPISNLEISFERSDDLDIYELSAKYRVLRAGPLAIAVSAGGDWRTDASGDLRPGYSRRGFFAQSIYAFSLGARVRVTAVPTWVSQTSGHLVLPEVRYRNLWNVPVALAIAVTRSVNVQGEIVPRIGKGDSPGVGWSAAVEKTVLRHRFSLTVGNLRATTVDQYVASDFAGANPHKYYLGFNLVRAWKLN